MTTLCDTPITILLPTGISKSDLSKWRDTLSYSVVERPAHGKLSDYTTTSDLVTYTPAAGYVGTDFFTYRMMVGSMFTSPVTMSITIHQDGGASPD
ncbi:hypothetical protein EON65_44385, partial [archaeon]